MVFDLFSIETRLDRVSNKVSSAFGPECEKFERWAQLQGLSVKKDANGDYVSKVTMVAKHAYRDGWKEGRCERE